MTTLSGRAIWEGEWAKPGVEPLAPFLTRVDALGLGLSPRVAPTPSPESPA